MDSNISRFEKETGIVFVNKNILLEALTHRSFLNEAKEKGLAHNERLEFLGDAVLELASTDFLYKEFSAEPEGKLTAYRAGLVNANILSEIASEMKLGEMLLLSKGEKKDMGKARQYILANAIEAVIGAIYLDRGYEAAETFIRGKILSRIGDVIKKNLWQDAKSTFQERAQEKRGITPAYKTLRESGPDHDKIFVSGAFLGEKLVAEGEGKSKQDAEQAAAASALETEF